MAEWIDRQLDVTTTLFSVFPWVPVTYVILSPLIILAAWRLTKDLRSYWYRSLTRCTAVALVATPAWVINPEGYPIFLPSLMVAVVFIGNGTIDLVLRLIGLALAIPSVLIGSFVIQLVWLIVRRPEITERPLDGETRE